MPFYLGRVFEHLVPPFFQKHLKPYPVVSTHTRTCSSLHQSFHLNPEEPQVLIQSGVFVRVPELNVVGTD